MGTRLIVTFGLRTVSLFGGLVLGLALSGAELSDSDASLATGIGGIAAALLVGLSALYGTIRSAERNADVSLAVEKERVRAAEDTLSREPLRARLSVLYGDYVAITNRTRRNLTPFGCYFGYDEVLQQVRDLGDFADKAGDEASVLASELRGYVNEDGCRAVDELRDALQYLAIIVESEVVGGPPSLRHTYSNETLFEAFAELSKAVEPGAERILASALRGF